MSMLREKKNQEKKNLIHDSLKSKHHHEQNNKLD